LTIPQHLAEGAPLRQAVTTTQTALGEASALVKAHKDALTDLEDQAMQDVLDDPALKNEAARKCALAAILRVSEPYQATKKQLDTALRAERMARVAFDDAERELRGWEKGLQAIANEALVEANRLKLEADTRYLEAAGKQLAARQAVAR